MNAIKHIGSHKLVVQSNVRKKYVRNIIKMWINIARSNLLHNIKLKNEVVDSYQSSGFDES